MSSGSLRALILSDVHVGTAARFGELATPNTSTPTLNGALDAFSRFWNTHDKVDLIFVLGDFTDTSSTTEVDLLQKTLIPLLDHSTKHNSSIPLITLGNHDVDWSLAGSGPDADNWGMRFYRLQNHQPLRTSLQFDSGSLLHAPYCGISVVNGIGVLSINSSTHDNADEAIHFGQLATETWEFLRQPAPASFANATYRLCLIHHHIRQPTLPFPDERDFSALQDAEKLMNRLRTLGIDLVLHGHTHCPQFRTESVDGGRTIGILNAGSFSARLPDRWCHRVKNCFHILNLDGRNPIDGSARGFLETFRYSHPEEWSEATVRDSSIHFREPFGNLESHAKLADNIVQLCFKHPDHLMTFSDLIKANPDLAYCRPAVLREAMDSLSVHDRVEIGILAENDWLIRKKTQDATDA